MTVVRTERLVLRKARAEDLAGLHAILSDPGAMRYWSTPPHTSLDETRQWLDAMIAGEGDDLILELEGQVIGKVGFWKDPEVGFILHPSFMGKGYAREALIPLLRRAFARGLKTVIADVDPRNAASLKLLQRLGFVETHRAKGTWQVGDELCDSVYLAVTEVQFTESPI